MKLESGKTYKDGFGILWLIEAKLKQSPRRWPEHCFYATNSEGEGLRFNSYGAALGGSTHDLQPNIVKKVGWIRLKTYDSSTDNGRGCSPIYFNKNDLCNSSGYAGPIVEVTWEEEG